MNRSGFALLAVLWLVTGASTLALAVTLSAREATAHTSYRIAHTRARWEAEGCGATVVATLDEVLWPAGGRESPHPRDAWDHLSQYATPGPSWTGDCRVVLSPVGMTIDVNRATDERLRRVMVGSGMSWAAADSLVDAILDWRDADDFPRPHGAERAWYERQGLLLPGNQPIAALDELSLVRGGEAIRGLGIPIGVEPARTPVNHAPLAVVASLPGVTPELMLRLQERRARRNPVTDLSQLSQGLSPASRDSLFRRFGELVQLATVSPEAWLLTVTSGEPARSSIIIEWRLASSSRRLAITRRREW